MKDIANNSLSGSFLKCRQTGMKGFLMEYLVDCYQSEGVFVFNKREVRLGLRDVALLLGLRVVNLSCSPNSIEETNFKDISLMSNKLAIIK